MTTPEPIDLAALGRAQTRGEDIRPAKSVQAAGGREFTVGEFRDMMGDLFDVWVSNLRADITKDAPR